MRHPLATARSTRRSWAALVVVLGVLAGCGDGAAPRHDAKGGAVVSGVVSERVDAERYTLLRLETWGGEVWAAVPAANVEVGSRVRVVNGVELKGYSAPAVGRTFETIVLGTLE